MTLFVFGIAAWAVLRSPLFVDKQPEVVGLRALRAERVLGRADLDRPVHLLSVNPSAVEARLSTHPWVEEARLRRVWPDQLVLEIVERIPVARVVSGGVPYPVDGGGVVLTPIAPEAVAPLPVITGLELEGAAIGRALSNPDALAAIAVAKQLGPALRTQASEIRVESGSRVVLHMRGGWEAKVGSAQNLELKLQVLRAVERDARAQGFNLTSIDVRTPLEPVVGTRRAQAR